MHSINIRVDDAMKTAIDTACKDEGRPMANYIKAVLTKDLRDRGLLDAGGPVAKGRKK
jgi:antitoxin component of RelBE/YafQ-DinJ toxin-antitoxin module